MDAAADEWGAYWQTAPADGCTAAFPPAVAGAIAARWRGLLAGLPANARLIDLACGRGALLALARERGLSDVVGVDAATVAAADAAIRGGIDAARLPFADASFDVAVSQFGVEYAGLVPAVAEAARVACRQVWLLLHAADGPVVGAGRELVAQADWLRAGVQAFTRLARHAASPDAASAADVEALRAAIVARAEAATNTSLLEAVWQAAGAQLAAPDAAAVASLANDVQAWARRLALLTGAAPDAASVAAVAETLRAGGWTVTVADEGAPPAARWLLASR